MEESVNIFSLFSSQKEYLNYFFENMDLHSVEKLLHEIAENQGVLFFTGVGKSGIIAQKIAQTILSTGTKSMYLPPTDALHGDIGIVTKSDVFFFLSKSGETKELLDLAIYVKKKGATLVAVVSTENSSLCKACDEIVFLPVKRELCPYNLAPTTSTTVQLIFGDLLSMALMKIKDFSLDEYAKNHPGGYIGKKISLQVGDLMIKEKNIPFCKPDHNLLDVLTNLSEKKCGCLLVVNDEKNLLGIFTDGDLRRSLQKYGAKALSKSISQLMTKKPLHTSPQKLAWEAMQRMEEERPVTVLPVLEDLRVVGLLRMHDILQSGLN